MKKFIAILALLFAADSFGGWVDDVGILERPTSPTAKPNMGIVWVDKLTKDLMFIDSDGLQYNILLGGGIGGAKLNDLSDVDTFTASPTVGQTIVFNGSIWTPANVASSLSSLTDVDLITTPPVANKVLGYDGSKWVPATGGKTLVAGQGVTIDQDATTATISSAGKTLVGSSPIVITQDATTATISVDLSSKEDTANKSATTTLGTSDVLFPTQNAVKTYVDTAISGIPSQKALAGSAPISVVSDATTSTITLDQSDLVHKGIEETISASKTFSAYINIGDPTIDGSYRFYKSGSALIYQKRVSGSWLETYRVE